MTDELNLENVESVDNSVENLDNLANLDASADAVEAHEQADSTAAGDLPAENNADSADNSADSTDSADSADVDPTDAGAAAVAEFSKTLRTLEGKWYVLHTYSGYEKRVKTNVESRVQSFGLEDKIFQIEVPMEEVEKHTDKGKKVITRVRVPGYVLIRMWPDENARRIWLLYTSPSPRD